MLMTTKIKTTNDNLIDRNEMKSNTKEYNIRMSCVCGCVSDPFYSVSRVNVTPSHSASPGIATHTHPSTRDDWCKQKLGITMKFSPNLTCNMGSDVVLPQDVVVSVCECVCEYVYLCDSIKLYGEYKCDIFENIIPITRRHNLKIVDS